MTTLLISTEEIRKSLPVKNLSDDYIVPAIVLAQDKGLEAWCGSKLVLELQEAVENDSVTEDQKDLLDNHIRPYLLWATMSEVIYQVIFKVRNAGVTQNAGEHVSLTTFKDADALRNQYQLNADYYGKRLFDWLCVNYKKFPAFTKYDNRADVPAHKNTNFPFGY